MLHLLPARERLALKLVWPLCHGGWYYCCCVALPCVVVIIVVAIVVVIVIITIIVSLGTAFAWQKP